MTQWAYLRITVSYNEEGLIDSASTGYKDLLSNVAPFEWDDYLTRLGDEGWELASVTMWSDGWDETYYIKKLLERVH